MFQLFKSRTGKGKRDRIEMKDINGNPLYEGDMVESFRYDMGSCKIIKDDKGFIYESQETSKKVSWVKMVDATTKFQKVRKIDM